MSNHTAKTAGIIELFDERVSQFPMQTAIVFGERQLNYEQLGKRANLLANFLKLRGRRQTLLAIYSDDSIHQITAIIATLKAGAAFVRWIRGCLSRAEVAADAGGRRISTQGCTFRVVDGVVATVATAATLTAGALKVLCLDRGGVRAAGEGDGNRWSRSAAQSQVAGAALWWSSCRTIEIMQMPPYRR